jgi:hypothetical protein
LSTTTAARDPIKSTIKSALIMLSSGTFAHEMIY